MSFYLKVTNREKTEDFKGNMSPSHIIPGIDYIKNAERSIGGKLHVDILGVKQTLQIVFDVLDEDCFREIKSIFETEDPSTDGLQVEYFADEITARSHHPNNSVQARRFFVDGFTFDPIIIGGKIKWRDVTVSLLEI